VEDGSDRSAGWPGGATAPDAGTGPLIRARLVALLLAVLACGCATAPQEAAFPGAAATAAVSWGMVGLGALGLVLITATSASESRP
jgi:hypothetical protein